jgi:hypothetical protein
MAMGLGVVVEAARRFYALDRIKEAGKLEDQLGGRALSIDIDPVSKVPAAMFVDDGGRPIQFFSRWYGFSAAYAGCDVWGG